MGNVKWKTKQQIEDELKNRPKTSIELLQEDNAMLALELALSQERLLASEQAQADQLFELSTKGVI
ncbi:hypothetical protein [Marinicrinis lubricantis]|uniref:Uncharacterized protein n=1 Tax=Marinicrinis lubricantis TaxID=2086470 RepID=A0ABW1IJ61_9BACL